MRSSKEIAVFYLPGNTTEKTPSMLVITTYSPYFFPLGAVIAFAASLFTAALARESRLWDRGPLGPGKPSLGLQYFSNDFHVAPGLAHTALDSDLFIIRYGKIYITRLFQLYESVSWSKVSQIAVLRTVLCIYILVILDIMPNRMSLPFCSVCELLYLCRKN